LTFETLTFESLHGHLIPGRSTHHGEEYEGLRAASHVPNTMAQAVVRVVHRMAGGRAHSGAMVGMRTERREGGVGAHERGCEGTGVGQVCGERSVGLVRRSGASLARVGDTCRRGCKGTGVHGQVCGERSVGLVRRSSKWREHGARVGDTCCWRGSRAGGDRTHAARDAIRMSCAPRQPRIIV
jgi:hypothetical protein